jgi:hypothetical protein
MDPVLKIILIVAGGVLAAFGLLIILAAPTLVAKRGLAAKKTIDPALIEHMAPEEQEKYRRDMAALDVKLRGLIFAVPGFILLLVALR